MNNLNELEIITVNYQTADLIDNLLTSRDKYGYKDIHVKVIDNSEEINHQAELNAVVRKYNNVTIDHVGFNLHHGLGLDRGIKNSTYKYCLAFDSDMEFISDSGLTKIMNLMTDEIDYVASVCHVNKHGIAISANWSNEYPYKYPHPALCLFRRDDYLKSPYKFVHHGAPSIAIAIGYYGKENKIVAFPFNEDFKTSGRGTVNRYGYRYEKIKHTSYWTK